MREMAIEPVWCMVCFHHGVRVNLVAIVSDQIFLFRLFWLSKAGGMRFSFFEKK